MYCGSNKTALASQRQVAQAMMQLIQEKPYSRITISELCKTAGISRQTFYSLFTSRENVMIFTIQAQYCCDLDEIPIHQARRQSEKLRNLCRGSSDCVFGGADPCLRRYASSFYAGGISCVAREYAREGCASGVDQLEELLMALFTGQVFPE